MANRKAKFGNYRIENEKDYNATMKKIDALMKKGEANLADKEAEELRILALAAQVYEKGIYRLHSFLLFFRSISITGRNPRWRSAN